MPSDAELLCKRAESLRTDAPPHTPAVSVGCEGAKFWPLKQRTSYTPFIIRPIKIKLRKKATPPSVLRQYSTSSLLMQGCRLQSYVYCQEQHLNLKVRLIKSNVSRPVRFGCRGGGGVGGCKDVVLNLTYTARNKNSTLMYAPSSSPSV